jgi:hypothetical protein
LSGLGSEQPGWEGRPAGVVFDFSCKFNGKAMHNKHSKCIRVCVCTVPVVVGSDVGSPSLPYMSHIVFSSLEHIRF